MTRFHGLLTAALLAATIGVAQAQTPPAAKTDEDHGAHHPAGSAAVAPAVQAPTGMPAGAASALGMGGMMGGDMGKMMQSMMPMTRMMMAGAGMARMHDHMSMMAPEHVEGRIAFLKTEIGITEAQLPQWTSFADALRQNAKGMMAAGDQMMMGGAPASATERLDRRIAAMAAQLDAARAALPPMKALYAVLTEAQRKVADTLLVPPMGRM